MTVCQKYIAAVRLGTNLDCTHITLQILHRAHTLAHSPSHSLSLSHIHTHTHSMSTHTIPRSNEAGNRITSQPCHMTIGSKQRSRNRKGDTTRCPQFFVSTLSHSYSSTVSASSFSSIVLLLVLSLLLWSSSCSSCFVLL